MNNLLHGSKSTQANQSSQGDFPVRPLSVTINGQKMPTEEVPDALMMIDYLLAV
jgi:hypothetical protein